MKSVHRDIGERIRAAREHAGLSQAQLAEEIGYAATNPVSKLERGVTASLHIVLLARIARACEVDLFWLMQPAIDAVQTQQTGKPRSERLAITLDAEVASWLKKHDGGARAFLETAARQAMRKEALRRV